MVTTSGRLEPTLHECGRLQFTARGAVGGLLQTARWAEGTPAGIAKRRHTFVVVAFTAARREVRRDRLCVHNRHGVAVGRKLGYELGRTNVTVAKGLGARWWQCVR